MYTINNVKADYNPCYDPHACNNGGGYWQPYGVCSIRMEDGEILHAEYNDTSCGGYGSRWDMAISNDSESWNFYVDEIGTDAEMQADYVARNMANSEALSRRFSIDAGTLICLIWHAINSAARNKYTEDMYLAN